MPENITINGGDTRSFDAPLRSVQVGAGSVIVTDAHDSTVVRVDETHDCGDTASLALYSPDGANLAITYADEPQAPPEPSHGVSAGARRKRAKKS